MTMRSRYGAGWAAVGLACVFAAGLVAQEAPRGIVQGEAATSEPTTTQPAAGGPRLEIEPKDFDFGDVWQMTPTKREFTIKNTGNEPLTIKAKSSCGCTMITRPKSPLAPGDSATFSIQYQTTHPGKTHKQVTLTTNDPAQPKYLIHVMGEVKALYEGEPLDRILFKVADEFNAETQTIRLVNKYIEPLNLKIKEGQRFERFKIELKEIEPGQLYEFTATTRPPLARGSNFDKCVLETGVELVPEITVNCYANVRPRMTVQPPTLQVTDRMTGPTERTLRLQFHDEKPVTITEVKSTPESIKCEIVPVEQLRGGAKAPFREVRVVLPAFAALPEEGGKVEIFTDDPSAAYKRFEIAVLKRMTPQLDGQPGGNQGNQATGGGSGPAGSPNREAVKPKAKTPAQKPQEAPAEKAKEAQPAKPNSPANQGEGR